MAPDYQYAKPTMSYRLKGALSKMDRPKKTQQENPFPFVTEAAQSKSHNLGVIIQQNLGKQKLEPQRRECVSQTEVTRQDIGEALINIEKELKLLSRYTK